jgi:hypothetical protein
LVRFFSFETRLFQESRPPRESRFTVPLQDLENSGLKTEFKMELLTGFEPVTSPLPRECSTSELQERKMEREKGLEPSTLSLEG